MYSEWEPSVQNKFQEFDFWGHRDDDTVKHDFIAVDFGKLLQSSKPDKFSFVGIQFETVWWQQQVSLLYSVHQLCIARHDVLPGSSLFYHKIRVNSLACPVNDDDARPRLTNSWHAKDVLLAAKKRWFIGLHRLQFCLEALQVWHTDIKKMIS